eukprot:2440919-Alexandrium_andersonii.AAC.1
MFTLPRIPCLVAFACADNPSHWHVWGQEALPSESMASPVGYGCSFVSGVFWMPLENIGSVAM